MNVSQHLRKLTKQHLHCFIKSPLKAVSAYQNKGLQIINGDASENNKMLSKHISETLSNHRNILNFQGCAINEKIEKPSFKKIIDPLTSIKIEINIPVSKILNIDLDLPPVQQREMIDPTKGIIEKKAERMIIARKKKMKTHKRKKWLKRFKTQLEKKRVEEHIKWLKETKEELQKLDAKGLIFSVEDYIDQKLARIRWTKPRNRVYGRLAPQWVIDDYEKKLEFRKVVKERIEYCDAVKKLKNDR